MMIIDPMNEDDSADEQRSPRAATQCRKSPGHELDATNGEHPVMVDGGDNVMVCVIYHVIYYVIIIHSSDVFTFTPSP